MKPVRILIADDHEVVRRGLRSILEAQPGWSVCAEALTGREAIDKAKALQPDVVILDISMPIMNGLEAARHIRKEVPRCEILVLTMHESDRLIREVLECGAQGYLFKSDAGRNLVSAVDALSNHKPFFVAKVAKIVLDGYLASLDGSRPGESRGASPGTLTAREREVLQLLAEGRNNKEVAVTLGISVKTAETHRANIMNRLSFHSMGDLVRYAIRNQIIEP